MNKKNVVFSIMDADELFFICGGSEQNSNSNDKGYDTTWELTVEGDPSALCVNIVVG